MVFFKCKIYFSILSKIHFEEYLIKFIKIWTVLCLSGRILGVGIGFENNDKSFVSIKRFWAEIGVAYITITVNEIFIKINNVHIMLKYVTVKSQVLKCILIHTHWKTF